MADAIIMRFAARCVTVAHAEGHEFDFEAFSAAADRPEPTRLFAERWKNKRLPLNADICRQAARATAEERFRERGMI